MRYNNDNSGEQARLDLWDDIAGPSNRESFAHLGDSFGGFPEDEGTIEPGSRDRPRRESEGILNWGDYADQAHGSPFNGEPVVHEEEAPDISLSPEEAFGGVGSGSHMHDNQYDTPVERGAWASTTPERDEARIAEIARRDALDRRQERDQQAYRTQQNGLEPVEFERQRPTGRMAPADVEEDPSVPTDRDPGTGRFVSRDRTDAGIGRKERSGMFSGWL